MMKPSELIDGTWYVCDARVLDDHGNVIHERNADGSAKWLQWTYEDGKAYLEHVKRSDGVEYDYKYDRFICLVKRVPVRRCSLLWRLRHRDELRVQYRFYGDDANGNRVYTEYARSAASLRVEYARGMRIVHWLNTETGNEAWYDYDSDNRLVRSNEYTKWDDGFTHKWYDTDGNTVRYESPDHAACNAEYAEGNIVHTYGYVYGGMHVEKRYRWVTKDNCQYRLWVDENGNPRYV